MNLPSASRCADWEPSLHCNVNKRLIQISLSPAGCAGSIGGGGAGQGCKGSRSQFRRSTRVFIYTIPENPMDSAPHTPPPPAAPRPRCPSQRKEGNKRGKGTQKGQGTLESKRKKNIHVWLSSCRFRREFLTPPIPQMLGFYCEMPKLENLPN